MFINTYSKQIYYVSELGSSNQAVSRARDICERAAVIAQVPIENCVPVAVNDKQVFSPDGIYQKQAEDDADARATVAAAVAAAQSVNQPAPSYHK
jgi:hypothetical protein